MWFVVTPNSGDNFYLTRSLCLVTRYYPLHIIVKVIVKCCPARIWPAMRVHNTLHLSLNRDRCNRILGNWVVVFSFNVRVSTKISTWSSQTHHKWVFTLFLFMIAEYLWRYWNMQPAKYRSVKLTLWSRDVRINFKVNLKAARSTMPTLNG